MPTKKTAPKAERPPVKPERKLPERASLTLGSRARNPKTSEIVARDLAAQIADAAMEEGTMLPTERVMAESLGVGRTTMREALRLLETRGVLTIRSGPGGGPVVRRPRPSDLTEALTLILQFESATFKEVMDARLWLEPTVARSAAAGISEEAIDALQELNDTMRQSAGDEDVMSASNRRFHSIIAEESGSVVLRIFSETILTIGDGRSVGIGYPRKQILAIADSHQLVIDALRAHDADKAELAMRKHLSEANTYWHRRFSDVISRPVRWIQ
ncbi:MAG TPA: FCD domain-containing protein [Baekduia sp.]